MITKVFAVYDTKALCYGVPFFMPTIGGAVRAFGDVCNDAQSSICKHPADYLLFHVGDFDDNKGLLIPLVPVVNLGMGSDFVAQRATVPDRVRSEILKVPVDSNSKGGN